MNIPKEVINISIRGLTLKQASPNGSGPIHTQQGIITAFAGIGWVTEGCTISNSACSGIASATGPETWYTFRFTAGSGASAFVSANP